MTPLGARRLGLHRRDLLAATVSVLAFLSSAQAATLKGIPDWSPNGGSPPQPVRPGPWQFFSPEEGAVVEALVDRLIPPDPNTPGGKEAGCAVFIDRQLAGPYGEARGLYMRPPFQDGDPQQGYQSPLTPAMRYRRSLAALDKYCQASFAGKRFHELPPDQQDKLIAGLQSGTVKLENVSGRGFFELLLQNTQEGFFADPVYGGNRDMAGWKMIGFPGTRYDYRDWVERHNEKYPLPPVGITGRTEWTVRHT
ncbi:MAG TPA: gluconate 2-dehydrogenase subunit 3 family protein [Acetobacteraceae bacterium]|jgi:gluconate 2-dehydrogenase gamma chain|nr:gluconate 2-dehydrogenase subunit 3 family protein [Acetobacteraceae bacterium]